MKEIYAWVPWFTELAQKIADGGPTLLVDRAKKIRWGTDEETAPLLRYRDDNIDPFSFLSFLSSKNPSNNIFPPVFSEVRKAFELKARDWSHRQYFPTAVPFIALFHQKGTGNPDTLWKLFGDAVRGRSSVQGEDFEAALQIPGVALAKLTQTLFLINPDKFLPWDESQKNLGIHQLPKQPTWDQYKQGIDNVRMAFPKCDNKEINIFSYLQYKEQLVGKSSKWFHIASKPEDDGSDRWADDFEPNNWVYTLRPSARLDDAPPSSATAHESPYPLEEPKRGDIVLVRKGESTKQVHALGVVYENDYAKARSRDSRIHVLWINKSSGQTWTEPGTAQFSGFGFGRFGRWTDVALSRIDEYAPTLKLLDRLEVIDMEKDNRENSPNDSGVTHAKNQILFGPPGTGKTWKATRLALAILRGVEVAEVEAEEGARKEAEGQRFGPDNPDGRIGMVTFHQNYSYEDFVEGIRPKLEGKGIAYELSQGIFRRMAETAANNPDSRYVLIIDEINRGNIAKILGELITLIEASRRAGEDEATSVSLPYSGETFSVPGNLYIIGTMNTADRSIQLLDTALRRRFRFEELMPNPDHERVRDDVEGVDCRKLMRVMNDRITALLDREHQIGHTNFFGIETLDELADRFQYKIFPLLQEYFFDDWGKIRRVLNNNAFVSQSKASDLPGGEGDYEEDSTIYERLSTTDHRWKEPEQYQKIYASNNQQSGSPPASDS